jgi:hypothetical protein
MMEPSSRSRRGSWGRTCAISALIEQRNSRSDRNHPISRYGTSRVGRHSRIGQLSYLLLTAALSNS